MFVLSRNFSKLFVGNRRCCHTSENGKPESFSKSRIGNFFQEQPAISNPFMSDTFLQRYMKTLLPENVWMSIYDDLRSFGNRVGTQIDNLGRKAELEPPILKHFDAWGNRVDDIITSQAWKDLHSISAEEGLVALAYERNHQQWSRLHQMVKISLFAPSSGLYSCPIAMTDGAARLIELSGNAYLKEEIFSRLITRNSEKFWTSGQWMTERQGGSDVGGGTSTIARGPSSNSSYKLYGYKWFSSAADAQIAFTLARIVNGEGLISKGSKGLSLFYLETKNENGHINNLEVQQLKNKLGTRQLPTAEILLEGTEAYLLGEKGCGISNISPMLNITRLHNSTAAVGNMRRMMLLCADYATKRIVFGKHLYKHPLHMQTLSRMEVQTRGCTVLLLEVCRLLGLSECALSSPSEDILLRILTPLLKLYTAKQAIAVASEGLEAFGGQGYIEDTGLPTLLRDAQVLSIWEGTTNVLSLDVVRVVIKFGKEVIQLVSDVILSRLLTNNNDEDIKMSVEVLKQQLEYLTAFIDKSLQEDLNVLHTAARDLSFTLAHLYIGSLLINHASKDSFTACDKDTALRWCRQPIPLAGFEMYTNDKFKKDITLVMNDAVTDQ